ncbi:cytochrome P450 [Dactylosporangium aurantiacum]|uniref:Cytochrome P450 n=2 Tax=Dactylosporangium aurantiacum TaxID=35754 RepID=A0A9Q9IDV8_9ACTN|nr:cytochrome P450 [Dactylosporangium aurantiacum]MDG6105109.1 cytochrome P450 [Dactylosporangium aurantiacum]UWZ51634.1 cytochrome P450 [Dactylosporangium aurantiacum]
MPDIVQNPEVLALLDELTRMPGRADPYPRYARLREISPVVRADDGALVVTGYGDCATVVRDPRLQHLPADMLAFVGFPDWREHPALHQLFTSMLTLNPPDHTRLRRLVSSAFTPRRVEALRPAIERMVQDLLDGMDGHDEVDFVEAFAFPLPVNVIGELLGVPAQERAGFQTLVRDWTQVLEVITPDVLARADPAAAAIRDHLAGLVEQRRQRPTDDLLSALVQAQAADDRLTDEEVLSNAALLFAAGFETTTNLLANGVVALLHHPEQYALLGRRPDLAQPAVEELLRYDSPVQLSSRVVTAPLELGGVTVGEGERVVAYLGAGNHDPARFPDPGALRLDRADNAPLSFGGGIHYCLGAPLARLEAQIALPALARRFPSLALTGQAQRRDSLSLKGYTSLRLRTG